MKTCPQCDTGYPDSQTTCPTHGLPLNEIRDLKPGMVIRNTYRIIRKLGQGGMGAVYLAQHTLMNEPQALKFLSSELSQDQAFTARFLREVRTLRQIRHKNVVDAGNLEPSEDGTLFFSMEFVDGPDLRGLLNACHPERPLSEVKGESKDLRLYSADELDALKGRDYHAALKGRGFSRAASEPNETAALAAEALYQGTASAVPQMQQKEARALAPEGGGDTEGGGYTEGGGDTEGGGGFNPRIKPAQSSRALAPEAMYQGTASAVPQTQQKEVRALAPAGALPVELALSIARQIAEGLGAAHAKGMVHRDIKPDNILLKRDAGAWLPKIADFGIVATKESSTAYTRTGGTLLTMAYAAPEQWRGTPAASLDGRTDLYALGGLLYEMLTGRSPFQAENYEGWSRQHQTTPPQPPSALRPDLANWLGLDALTLRLLAKDRNDRPKDVAELIGMIDAVRYLPLDAHGETVVENPISRATKLIRALRLRRLPRWLWITSVLVMGLTVVIAGLALGMSTSVIAKRADDLDKKRHYNLGGILRNLACTRGYGEACFNLGLIYHEGIGVAVDDPRAVAFYTEACADGNGESCNNLGNMYLWGRGISKDYSRAAGYIVKACDAGDSLGCSSAGNMYSDGKFVQKDDSRAAEFYAKGLSIDSKKCDEGNSFWCGFVAMEYENGADGVAKDIGKARQFYRKACSMDENQSCEDLKKLDANEPKPAQVVNPKPPVYQPDPAEAEIEAQATLFRSQGRDSEAAPLFDQACNGGYPKACRELGYMYANGYGVKTDLYRAVNLFSKACAGGYANGCSALGYRYETGDGVEKDESRAVSLYLKACNEGDIEGCNILGNSYLEGIIVRKDSFRAVFYFSKACDAGDSNACGVLGYMYEKGDGVKTDSSRARAYYTKACGMGSEVSCGAAKKLH
jgi:hypothetical protein